jgi:predicted permease
VANMMLARAMARQREIGIRLAMGAGRARLILQLLTESVLLALPGGVAGFGISRATMDLGERLMFATLPKGYADFITLAPLHPDGRVFVFMLAAAVVSALLFGLAPAIQATRSNVMQAARGEFTTDFRPARLRNMLVIGQVTASALFLICAATLLRGKSQMQRLDVGLKTQGVVEVEIQDRWRAQVLRHLAAEPGLRIVAGASKVPFMGLLASAPVMPGGSSAQVRAGYLYVSPEYFPVFRIPLLRGRAFTAEEARAGAPVAVVSQTTAQRLWPNSDALGQNLRIVREASRENDLTQYHNGPPQYSAVRIVGIARDAVNGWVGDANRSSIYFPTMAQAPGNILLVRANADAEALRQELDRTLAASVPGAVDQIHTMDEILAGQLYPFRALYWLTSAIGGVALLLTVSGIYGVLSYLVSQRTKEIGIRVALGASTARVAGLVMRQSLRFTIIGTVLGAVAALAVSRLLAAEAGAFVFNTIDGWAFGLGAALVVAASVCAAYVPSRRAARIEPITTLRYD